MILHLKSPNAICINQQSDLLMYSSGQKKRGYSSSTLYHASKWKGRPRDFNAIKYTKNRLFIYQKQVVFRSASSFAPKWSKCFTCFGEIVLCFKDFLFCYVRYYLSQVTRKPVFGLFGQLRFNRVCSAIDFSYKPEISDIEIRCIILSRQGTTKTLIRLCRCTG